MFTAFILPFYVILGLLPGRQESGRGIDEISHSRSTSDMVGMSAKARCLGRPFLGDCKCKRELKAELP